MARIRQLIECEGQEEGGLTFLDLVAVHPTLQIAIWKMALNSSNLRPCGRPACYARCEKAYKQDSDKDLRLQGQKSLWRDFYVRRSVLCLKIIQHRLSVIMCLLLTLSYNLVAASILIRDYRGWLSCTAGVSVIMCILIHSWLLYYLAEWMSKRSFYWGVN